MNNLKYLDRFYLDKEKDIVVELYKNGNPDELSYIIRTPSHKSGNLITNLAMVCGVETTLDNKGLKIISNVIPASINGDGSEVYIFRLAGMKIANIYEDRIEVKAKMPAIIKTLISQTKHYKYDIKKTIVKSYIFKKSKFKTDLHTHMNANLSPDVLISLGIARQLRYPLYYIKKIDLKLSPSQIKKIMAQRDKVEAEYADSGLEGKALTRKIDDNTFINFADLIINNPKDAEDNIRKIRASLALLKDGQAVFTNLEKLYVYRYVFCKGTEHKNKIKITDSKINAIPDRDIRSFLRKMMEDKTPKSPYKNNTLRQDKLLWIAREYGKQHIEYVEITDTDLAKNGEPGIKALEDIHEIMPKIEKETGVRIRFLIGIRRIPLNLFGASASNNNYSDVLCVLKALAKSPYIVGSDFIGEEINDIAELKPVIKELVRYTATEDENFTIRIHAGENDCLRTNVAKAISCVKDSLLPGQKMPKVRLGHGLYTADLSSQEGKDLMKTMKNSNVILEFQLTSNVRLNNLTDIEKHPIKQYLDYGVKCVQGTDGCGIYGTDTFDEQLALHNLLELDDSDFEKMRRVEDEIIEDADEYFKEKNKKFKKFIHGRSLREAMFEEENVNLENAKKINLNNKMKINAEEQFKDKIIEFPQNKVPLIIAGGSFNGNNRETIIDEQERDAIKELVANLDEQKVYFVVGHTMSGYEKAFVEAAKSLNKDIEITAIVPNEIDEYDAEKIITENIDGVRISPEKEMGLYKSFNYEIFERRNSIVLAFDGNSPVSNLVQEAKNGKGKAGIYVNSDAKVLKDKANSLDGYVKMFKLDSSLANEILEDYPEITKNKK